MSKKRDTAKRAIAGYRERQKERSVASSTAPENKGVSKKQANKVLGQLGKSTFRIPSALRAR